MFTVDVLLRNIYSYLCGLYRSQRNDSTTIKDHTTPMLSKAGCILVASDVLPLLLTEDPGRLLLSLDAPVNEEDPFPLLLPP